MYEGGPKYVRNLNHRPLITWPSTILDNVSSSGSAAGFAASSHRGSTVRGNVSNAYEYFNTMWTGDADLRLYITTVQDG